MNSVSFEEEKTSSPLLQQSYQSRQGGFITRLLFKLGLAKEVKNANMILIAVAIFTTLIAAIVLITTPGIMPGTRGPKTLTEEQQKLRETKLQELKAKNDQLKKQHIPTN